MSHIAYVFAFLLCTQTAFSLKCYICNSKDNKLCDWGFTSFTYSTEECQSAGLLDSIISPKCYKITAEGKDGSSYIARGCSPPGMSSIVCSGLAKSIGWVSSNTDDEGLKNLACETCETDKCNSAEKVATISLFGVVLAAIAFIL